MVDLIKKRGLICPSNNSKLTISEQEILNLITNEFLTINQIMIRRNCSKQAVYKIVKILKQKGALNQGLKQVDYFQPTSQPNRLHGQEIHIKIISKSDKYRELLQKSNLIYLEGHTIRLYKDSIELYAGSGLSFFGEDENRATSKSLEYWNKFITRLENEFRVILKKPRVQNIKIVNQHYAVINSGIAEESYNSGRIYKIYSEIDGKLMFVVDNSFNLKEDECLHPEDSKQHRTKISKHFNDICNNNPPTNSELSSSLQQLVNIHLSYAKHLESHTKAIIRLEKGINKLVNIKKNDLIKDFKTNQKTLGDF